MVRAIVDAVVPGRDGVKSEDDPVSRTIGFTVSGPEGSERHFARMTASMAGMDPDLLSLLRDTAGRRRMALLMQHRVDKHGHGYGPSGDCPACLALEVMES